MAGVAVGVRIRVRVKVRRSVRPRVRAEAALVEAHAVRQPVAAEVAVRALLRASFGREAKACRPRRPAFEARAAQPLLPEGDSEHPPCQRAAERRRLARALHRQRAPRAKQHGTPRVVSSK